MRFFEAEKKYKVGPFEFGKKPGRELIDPWDAVWLTEDHNGPLGYPHPIFLSKNSPDEVNISTKYGGLNSCLKCDKLSIDLVGDQIKKNRFVRKLLVVMPD